MAHVVSVSKSEDDMGPLLNRVTVSQYTIAVIVVALRFFTRGCIVRKFGLDDCFIGVAVLLGAVQTATIILQVENGRGRHAVDLTLDQFSKMLMWKWINLLVYFVANWAVKMSILALYHRIGSGKRGLPWILKTRVIWSFAIVLSAFTLAIFLAELFGCTPISEAWNVEKGAHECMHNDAFNIMQGSVNVFTDLLLLIFPLPLLRLLKINTKQRTALVIIFSIGLIPLVASIMRLSELIMSGIVKGQSRIEADTSWRWAWVPVWSQIEVNVGIVAACLPSLSPLLKHVWSGFATHRPMTPSRFRTFTKPRDSCGLQALPSHSHPSIENNDRKVKGMTFFDDMRHPEEEESVHEGEQDILSRIETAQTVVAKMSSAAVSSRHSDSGG